MELIVEAPERDKVLKELNLIYKYNGEYWFPLANVSIDQPTFVITADEAEKHGKTIENFIKAGCKSFYLTGESGYCLKPFQPYKKWLQEVDFIEWEYGPVEFVYFDKDFKWLIYVSHEQTVTFCGEKLVEFVKTHIK